MYKAVEDFAENPKSNAGASPASIKNRHQIELQESENNLALVRHKHHENRRRSKFVHFNLTNSFIDLSDLQLSSFASTITSVWWARSRPSTPRSPCKTSTPSPRRRWLREEASVRFIKRAIIKKSRPSRQTSSCWALRCQRLWRMKPGILSTHSLTTCL